MTDTQYPIGTPGTPWDDAQKQAWRSTQVKRRSYQDEVLRHLEDLHTCFQVQRYGELIYPEGRYPLYGIVTRDWNAKRPAILVTGGVHGYETSGVQGAVRFVQTRAVDYTGDFNIAVAPCISPWAYETINRWNPDALDPNRSFVDDSPCGEAALAMAWVRGLAGTVLAHFDLHETTDTDNSEFRPALAARDGMTLEEWPIPDGFYLVDDSEAPQPEFQRAIIDAVKTVT
ncbi:MAG: M14 family metallocarboxypeptidase, partial [Halieaceae bacterium]|nr:M14 family metallocarboxypeptidase [Halieaceae bacterium]